MSDTDPVGRFILFGAAALGMGWVISTALHENIEHFSNLEKQRENQPLTEDEQLAKELIKLREARMYANVANNTNTSDSV